MKKGQKHSAETLKKMRGRKGQIPWNKGKKLTESQKKRMSLAQKKRFETEEVWNKGKKRPKEWSQKQSVSLKKRYADGLVPPNKGKKASEELRKRMSEAQKKLFASGYVHPMQGKHHSEESKQKMSESNIGRPPNSGSFKKGEHGSRKTEFKKGDHHGKEFKKGDVSWNIGAKYVYSEEELKKYQNTNQKVKFLRPESRESRRKKMKLILMNPKYRENQSKRMKLLWQDPKRIEEASKTKKKFHAEHPEVAKKIGLKLRGKKHTDETRKKLSIFQKRFSKTKFTPEYRKKLSIAARKIKRPQRDNKFELSFQAILREKDIEFKDHVNLIGQPDIFIEPNLCIFLDGDRFHANPSMYSDDTIIWKEYNKKGRHVPAQTAKIIHEKDERINNELRTDGYEIIRIWQSEFDKDPEKCLQKIIKAIKKSKQ